MQETLAFKFDQMRGIMTDYGVTMVRAMLIVVIGLVVLQWTMKKLKAYLDRTKFNRAHAATIIWVIYVLVVLMVALAALVEAGFDVRNVIRLLIVITLGAIAVIIVLRPYIPTLPFKVGNTVKVGSLLGKIESTTMLHTRMRTFDGKTVFIPNSKILNDFIINYHFTPTRRIKIDIPIRHVRDILRTKQRLEAIMIHDPRVLRKPSRPVVYVINLVEGCIKIGARCWVANPKFWVARCDLLEKMLIGLEQDGIRLAFRRKVIQVLNEGGAADDQSADHLQEAEIAAMEAQDKSPLPT